MVNAVLPWGWSVSSCDLCYLWNVICAYPGAMVMLHVTDMNALIRLFQCAGVCERVSLLHAPPCMLHRAGLAGHPGPQTQYQPVDNAISPVSRACQCSWAHSAGCMATQHGMGCMPACHML